MRAHTSRRAVTDLIALAARKGYDVQRATMADCWWLVRSADNARIEKEDGSTAFTPKEAKAFLARLPDA
jgi:hypothetical protein